MKDKIKVLEEKYFVWDDPVPFKGLDIFPVSIRNYEEFRVCSLALDIDKDSIPDVNIISMNYLDFLGYLYGNNDLFYVQLLIRCIELCFHVELSKGEIDLIHMGDTEYELEIKGVRIDAREFDEIRKIILYQNFIHYDDTYIDPELKEDMQEFDRIKNKDFDMPSLEDQVICLMASGHDIETLKKLTIRKFNKLLSKVDEKLSFQINKTGELAGAKFKDDIQHWIYPKKKDKYGSKVVDFDSFKNKIEGAH